MDYICTKCGKTLPEENFPLDPKKKNGRKSHCRGCCAEAKRGWRIRKLQEDPGYERRKYQENPEAHRAAVKKHRSLHLEEVRERVRNYHQSHKKERHESYVKWYYENGGRWVEKEKRFLYGYMGQSSTGKKRRFGGYLLTQGVCLFCGETNPLLLENAHIFPDNHEELISLCCNCHRMVDKHPSYLEIKFPEDGWEDIDLDVHDDEECELE